MWGVCRIRGSTGIILPHSKSVAEPARTGQGPLYYPGWIRGDIVFHLVSYVLKYFRMPNMRASALSYLLCHWVDKRRSFRPSYEFLSRPLMSSWPGKENFWWQGISWREMAWQTLCTAREDSLLPSGALTFQHTLGSTAIPQLQEEIYHLKKQRQIFDLDDYPAGVSSSP